MSLRTLFEKSRCTDYDKWLETRRRNKRKGRAKSFQLAQDLKTPCLFCGAEEVVYHHVDPNTKSFSLSGARMHTQKQVREEVKKCWCLCEDCHVKLHQRLVDPLPICFDSLN